MSASQIGPIPQHYAAAATVPLIKSPSLWLPPPVELPTDIHPLPEDITAYFVYPFTLEQHVLSLHPPPHIAIAERRARNAAILHAREVEEEERERAELHKVAPGYNPAAMLVPTHRRSESQSKAEAETHTQVQTQSDGQGLAGGEAGSPKEADPMDDLVAQLEQMESSRQ